MQHNRLRLGLLCARWPPPIPVLTLWAVESVWRSSVPTPSPGTLQSITHRPSGNYYIRRNSRSNAPAVRRGEPVLSPQSAKIGWEGGVVGWAQTVQVQYKFPDYLHETTELVLLGSQALEQQRFFFHCDRGSCCVYGNGSVICHDIGADQDTHAGVQNRNVFIYKRPIKQTVINW